MTLVGLKNNNFTVVPMTKVPTSHNGGWFSPTQIRYNGSNTDMMVGTLFFQKYPNVPLWVWEGYYSIHDILSLRLILLYTDKAKKINLYL